MVLKPNRNDVNVGPQELAAHARSQGLQVQVGVNGNTDMLRLLLTNGLPVLVETWFEPKPGDGMGHYRLLTGYDDAQERWIAFDSYVSAGVDGTKPYRGIHLDYGDLEELWAVFNNTYIVLYTEELSPAVLEILGEDMDEAKMWHTALSQARTTVEQQPSDAFAWFNLGTDLVALAEFQEAAAAYDRAREIGLPWRMLWYQFGPFQAYYEVGRFKDLVALADATLLNVDDSEELYYWKGQGLAAQGDTAGAKVAWNQSMQLNPNYAEAAEALAQASG
jgi:tetratricopeptide (TPR) repeat protein